MNGRELQLADSAAQLDVKNITSVIHFLNQTVASEEELGGDGQDDDLLGMEDDYLD